MKLPPSTPGPAIDPKLIKVPKLTIVGAVNPPVTPGPVPPTAPPSASHPPDAPDDSSPIDGTHAAAVVLRGVSSSSAAPEGQTQPRLDIDLIQDRHGVQFVVIRGGGNPRVFRVGSEALRGLIAQELRRSGGRVTQAAISEVVEELKAQAIASGTLLDVYSRVAQLPDGTRVIALHDEANTQVWIKADQVSVVSAGSTVPFCRTPVSAPMVMPASTGNYKLLKAYLNLCPQSFVLYIAWITYTLAHAKQPGNVFVILLLLGGQGTGKSLISKLSIRLVDPNVIGVSRMPSTVRDLGIAAQQAHLLAFDNQRRLTLDMSDALCILATGGTIASRRLYTDDQQQVLQLHGALLLNGIHGFVDQPDLAQRCLPLRLDPMDEANRASEAELLRRFEDELPVIQRGLFDLIAAILKQLPVAQVTNPQRMLSFCQWLAAFELADGHPMQGIYQDAYADFLNEGQLDSIRDNVVGSAVLAFAQQLDDGEWSGTPKDLLAELTKFMAFGLQRPPRTWPDNEISLSKRLNAQIAALSTQGVIVVLERRKERTISIKVTGASQNSKY